MSRYIALVLATILAACTAEDPSVASTTEITRGSTTRSSTTTLLSTTTTVTVPVSTTTPIEGIWAEVPLVVYDDWGGMALGWWDGSEWVQVTEETSLPVSGDETYRVALLGSRALIEGSAPANRGCEVVAPNGFPGVQLSDGNALYTIVDDGSGGERVISGVAISAPWDIHPRPAEVGEWHPDLENLAFELLSERGFVTDSVNNIQTLDADLDGDASLETLVMIEETRLANSVSAAYSMLFVVSPSSDAVHVVAESVIPSGEDGFPASFRVSDIADLSGDGKMEVVVDGLAWENGWVTVYELTESGFVERISGGCGV